MRLLFQIGRGGRFNNPGHTSFVCFGDLTDSAFYRSYDWYLPTKKDEEGNEILDEDGNPIDDESSDAIVRDGAGNELGITYGELTDGIGKIDSTEITTLCSPSRAKTWKASRLRLF